MASPKLFGLPPVPPELKVINPFLQRADELKSKEPVMTYWCLYYAAQLGLSIKPHSPTLLFALLNLLESMKNEIGQNDAVDIQAASIAYVENFGLKVFSSADEEDRKGLANRSTAKKFLAAANFLEVLKIFPKEDVPESNEEKIRYAKWKAAEIAKAFREGRKPAPGPAGSELETPPLPPSPPVSSSPPSIKPPSPTKRTTPPPHMDPSDIARANSPHTPPSRPRDRSDGDGTPGSWSTAATPGTPVGPGEFGTPTYEGNRFGFGQDTPSGKGKGTSRLRNAWVSEEDMEEGSSSLGTPGTGGLLFPPKKTVTFTPSVVGGLSSNAGSPPPSPTLHPLPEPGENVNRGTAPHYDYDPAHQDFPPGFIPTHVKSLVNHAYLDQTISPFSLSPHLLPQDVSPPIPPPPPPATTGTNLYPAAPNPVGPPSLPAFLPPPVPQPPSTSPSLLIHQPRQPPVEVELSPTLIAKTQKHCRFAISALDYEDAAQARKELRAALALLGG